MRVRRHFTVIEVIIALSLTALVMTSLTFFYMQIQQLNTKAEKSLQKIYQIAYLQNRLSAVIPKAIAETNSKKDFLFYSDNGNSELIKPGTPSLVFTYDNGTDMNKALSNNVVGRLFLDNNKRLILATWPSYKRWKDGTQPIMKKEVLLENVEDLSFSFFVASGVDRGKVIGSQDQMQKKKIAKPEPPLSWIKDWRFEFYELPAIMRVQIIKEGKPIIFTFPLPNSTKVPYYYQ